MYDAIVIGAGPAGLQAALTLGRMHRSTLLLDSGEYRNGTVLHMHNVVANDGTPRRSSARPRALSSPSMPTSRSVTSERSRSRARRARSP